MEPQRDIIRIMYEGPLAMIKQPHLRGDPYSYPCLTAAACHGKYRALLGSKPEVLAEAQRVFIYNPIQYESMGVKALKNSKDRWSTTIQTCTYLTNVRYGVEYKLRVNPYREPPDAIHKQFGYHMRRLREGKVLDTPCFGTAECMAEWELWEGPFPKPLPINLSFASYFERMPIDILHDRWEPMFFRAEVIDGILTFPEELHEARRDVYFRMRHEMPKNRGSRENGVAHAS